MVLRYKKYLQLMEALKEYAEKKGIKQLEGFSERQSAIFRHFMSKYGSFVAENGVGVKRLFWMASGEMRKKGKSFRKFMKSDDPNHPDNRKARIN
jgi:hypothetical protein